jgi:putative transport protein
MFNSLGSICGGMTSTPALGTLIRVAETDDVATSYAATYPIALAVIVITFQLVCIIF